MTDSDLAENDWSRPPKLQAELGFGLGWGGGLGSEFCSCGLLDSESDSESVVGGSGSSANTDLKKSMREKIRMSSGT